jgi:hypothetical protein
MKKWKNQPPTDRFLSTRTRETREVLTKLKMGTQRGQMNGVLSWLVRWAGPAGTRGYYSALAAQYKIFFSSPYTFSIPLSPSPSQLGRQPCWAAYLLVCVSEAESKDVIRSPHVLLPLSSD